MTEKSTARVAAHEQRKRAAGLTQRKVWAHPNDWPALLALARELAAARTITTPTSSAQPDDQQPGNR